MNKYYPGTGRTTRERTCGLEVATQLRPRGRRLAGIAVRAGRAGGCAGRDHRRAGELPPQRQARHRLLPHHLRAGADLGRRRGDRRGRLRRRHDGLRREDRRGRQRGDGRLDAAQEAGGAAAELQPHGGADGRQVEGRRAWASSTAWTPRPRP